MLDTNSIFLAGWLKGSGVNEGTYPSGWIRVHLEAIVVSPISIPGHTVFLRCPLDDKNRQSFASLGKDGWVFINDATLNSYRIKGSDRDRRELRFSLSKVQKLPSPRTPVNLATLTGKCMEVHDEQWAKLAMSYKNIKTGEWKQRIAVILAPEGHRMTVGGDYFVQGQVSGKDLANLDNILIIAEKVSGS